MSRGGALDSLTGLRFFAALHVVLFHFSWPYLGTAPEGFRNWVAAGYSAVGVFFVLSGFVLAWNYLDRDGHMETRPRAFLAARVARVYPVYLLTFLLSAPPTIAMSVAANGWVVAAGKLTVGGLSTLALVQAWVPRLALYWNPPAWSVAVEAVFYVLFPGLALWVLPRQRPSRLPVVMGVVWVLGLLPPLLFLALRPDGAGPVTAATGSTVLMVIKFNPLMRLPEFLFGVLLGWGFVRERADGAKKGSGAVLAFTGAALLVAAGVAGPLIPYPLMHNALLAPASGLLVYGLARGGGPLGWLLSRPLLVHLGGASYALYLLQYPLSEGFKALRQWVDLQSPVLMLALSVLASVAVHRYVETPFRSRVRKALQPWVDGESRVSARPVVPGA
jgi:peptidoglycan/LPS O-acetylase OafA/YrhL